MTTDIPRLTDAELREVLAPHGKASDDPRCLQCGHLWPCETVRLAKMAQDLLAVKAHRSMRGLRKSTLDAIPKSRPEIR
jgi:hypothetical protein